MAGPMQAHRKSLAALGVVATLLTGCASSGPPVEPAQVEFTPQAGVDYPIEVSDPIEGFNRWVYVFNARFDQFVFLPVVRGYEFITPVFVQDRVSDFFLHLGEVTTFTNSLLQLKGDRAGRAALRFVINTMFGFAGLYDIASAYDIERESEDFGQTLGYWGVGNGPYLVLPILGPSNLRDTGGLITDAIAFSLFVPETVEEELAYKIAMYGLRPIDARHRIAFRYHETGTPFEYDLVRFLYTKKREIDIRK